MKEEANVKGESLETRDFTFLLHTKDYFCNNCES